jgi:hypothetical protein
MRVNSMDMAPVSQIVSPKASSDVRRESVSSEAASKESKATAQSVESGIQTSNDIGLGLSGTFMVNSGSVVVYTKDSLSSIARKVNLVSSTVDAMVITLSPPQHKLVIISRDDSPVTLSDKEGRVLKDLDILTESNTIANDSSSMRVEIQASGSMD